MALKKARKVAKKPASDDAAGASSSMAPPPPPGPGGASKLKPPLLPPGVYFSPTHKESLGFLNRWIAGDKKMPDARGFIFHADVYANNPYALRQLHSPASSRAGQHTWWFLSENKFQSPSAATKRADRSVQTGGYWRLEQGKEELEQEGGLKNSFGFYFGPPKKRKTPWLMQEFTSNKDNGAGKKGVPALHKLYVTPRATDDDLRAIYGEDGVTVGNKKPVPADYFHAAAALLTGSARGLGQEHVGMPQASQPPPPVDLLHYDGQNFMGDIMPVGLHYDSQKGQNFMGAAMPANVLGQYQQQHRHYCRGVAPPAPLGLHDEDAPSDNLSMPMDQFMRILDEPAEKIKGEPEWGSSEDIVDHDEFVNFNKDG